ncbi:zinc ribbon domain-containing protein [Streptomyces sp. NBC_01013]|uniref:zinc ribbon domain-containing protein n=1 Tax=Streptomyces sp. NBC_01013 TaxID=2903718 RepID=UPI003868E9BF|nr:zinc ribbon domain-containing protein [Streptomyces sp. NBC_01013]
MPAAPPLPPPAPPAAVVPPAPAGPPPPPGYAPMPAAPAGPSPLGAFFGRVFRGDWAGSVKAAAWPSGLIVALAVALSIPTYGQGDDVVVGWSDRLRIALAMLLQAFGGGFELRPAGSGGLNPSDYGSDYDYGSDFDYGSGGPDFGSDFAGLDPGAQGSYVLALVPLTVTVLWIGALILGARTVRRQGGGLEAAVRISLVATAAVLLLGLFAQPEVADVSVSSSPVLAALGALVMALLVAGGVLQRDAAARWLAERPGTLTLVRAAGTALRALGVVVLLCSVVGFVTYATADDVDGEALLIALPLLPNIGLQVLGVSWGAHFEYDLRGWMDFLGSGTEHGTVGLSDLDDAFGGWAVTGALVTGVVCALTVGLLAARRSAGRGEQATVGGLFLLLFLVLAAVGGMSAELSGSTEGVDRRGTVEFALSLSDVLLFGLLWVGGAVFVAPYLLRLTGRPGALPPAYPGYPAAAPGAYAPYAPTATTTPMHVSTPTTAGAGPFASAPEPSGRRRSVAVWCATLAAALLVGGGVTAGVLALKDRDGDDNKPAPTRSSEPATESPQSDRSDTDGSTDQVIGPDGPSTPRSVRPAGYTG